MQLWEVKHETANRALHAQLINSLFEKTPALSVQVCVCVCLICAQVQHRDLMAFYWGRAAHCSSNHLRMHKPTAPLHTSLPADNVPLCPGLQQAAITCLHQGSSSTSVIHSKHHCCCAALPHVHRLLL
jgi:hypothetical protein